MRPLVIILIILVSVFHIVMGGGNLMAVDTVRLLDGRSQRGSIVHMTTTAVTLDRNGTPLEIPANQIQFIQYENDPPTVITARTAFMAGRYEDTIKLLNNVDVRTLAASSPYSAANVVFLQAMAPYRLATNSEHSAVSTNSAGVPNPPINGVVSPADESTERTKLAETGKRLNDFLRTYPTDWHFYEVLEAVADVLILTGNVAARGYYEKLGEAPWPETKAKSQIALGTLELIANQPDTARMYFQAVLQSDGDSQQVIRQKRMANIGLAKCFVSERKYDEAVSLLENCLSQTAATDVEAMAGYTVALGDTLEATGKWREAILAFLQVDILFPQLRREHLHSLRRLAVLWRKIGRDDRAKQAEITLQSFLDETVTF